MTFAGMRSVWLTTVLAPLIYISLLPVLSNYDPFGTGTFASPVGENVSISAFVTTPQANAGFVLFTMPSLVYLWINPITRTSTIALIGTFIFSAGYVIVVLFPLNFASSWVHHSGFVLGTTGFFMASMGLLLSVNFSPVLVGVYAFVVFCNIMGVSALFLPPVVFTSFEYINAIFVVTYAPLVNTFGEAGWWIRLHAGKLKVRLDTHTHRRLRALLTLVRRPVTYAQVTS